MKYSLKVLLLMLGLSELGMAQMATAGPYEDAGDAFARADYAKAELIYRSLAGQGNTDAQQWVGYLYEFGKGVPQDYKEAVKWYRLAADQGNESAQWYLGTMYEEGKGVSQSDKEAVKWFRFSAQQGNADGQWCLGVMYELGKGVPQDYLRAHMFYNLSAASSSNYAKYRDDVARKMPASKVVRAQEMAKDCRASNYKSCD